MDGQLVQTLLAGVIVAGAAAYAGRRWLAVVASARVPKGDAGCGGGGCGCSAKH